MIKGTYIYYQDGKEIARSSNVITKFGKRFLTNTIAGNVSNLKKDIAVGIDYTSATENDTKLGFEFYRVPVFFGSSDIQTVEGASTYSTIFKTSIPQDVEGHINEIGLYPSTRSSINNFDSKFLTDFSSYLDWTDEDLFKADFSTNNPRIGNNLVVMQSDGSSSNEYFYNISPIDLSGYSANDTLRLAYNKLDANLSSIKIRLYSSPTQYFQYQISAPSSLGNTITSDIPMSLIFAGASVSAPDKSSINKIGITITPSGSSTTYVGFDGLRINDEDTFDPFFGLISRSVVINSTSISGTSGQNTITVGSINNLFVGQPVSGTGIASGALISSILNNTVTLSKNNTATVSGSGSFYGIKKIAGRSLDIEYKLDLDWN
jgi:hypothetical protein